MNITTVSTSLLGVAAAAMLAACAPNLVVPTPLAGTVKVKIVNDTDDSLCTITLTPDSKNIVGGAFFSHRDGMIALKPGLYQIHASSVGCGGGLSGDGRVEVREATELHIGGTARAASPGFAFASIGMGFDQSAQRASAQPAAEESNAAPASSSSSSSSSSPSSPSSSKPAPSGPACKPLGAAVQNSHECCSTKTVWRTPNFTCCESGNGCS